MTEKISYHDCIKFIIWYNGRNNDTEATEYFKVFKKRNIKLCLIRLLADNESI